MSAIVDSVLAELRAKLAKAEQSGPRRPVFATEVGNTWGRIDTAFSVAVRRAGIERFRFHDLRHTCASHLIMNGASLTEIKEILGHQDVKMTLRDAHLAPGYLRAAVGRLDEVFGSVGVRGANENSTLMGKSVDMGTVSP